MKRVHPCLRPPTPSSEPSQQKADLQALEERFEKRFTQFEEKFIHLEEKLIEAMRDMQTELLRGFASHNTGLTVRMRKLEADQSNLDAAVSPRLALLEQQVTDMNVRLMKVEMR